VNATPTKEQVADDIILGLADLFESGSTRWYRIEQDEKHPEEFEPLRECLADMMSEGWLVQFRPAPIFKLTPEGYKHLRLRIYALRALGH
jgi:hypothetical protein